MSKRPLRTIEELLGDIEPLAREQLRDLKITAAAGFVSFEIALPRGRFPVAALVRYVLVARGCTDLGTAEKTAWQYAFGHGDWIVILALRKFGLRLRIWCSTADEAVARAWARQFLGRLRASQRSAELELADLADHQIGAGDITLQNQYPSVRLTYEYFREGVRLALDGSGRIPARSADGSFHFAREQREAFYNLVAMCSAYFSMLEHVLVLSIPFVPQVNWTTPDIRAVIGMSWSDKYRVVLGASGSLATDYLSKLMMIAERYRNTYGHGAFGKDDATIYFHAPGVGVIPGNMTRVSQSPQFSLIPAADNDFEKVCAVFDGWEADVADHLIKPAWSWICSGLDVRYDRVFRDDVDRAVAEGRFDEFLDESAREWELHANMDY
jgi:hypothetical protein